MKSAEDGTFRVNPTLLVKMPPVCVTSTGPASNPARGTQNEECLRYCCSHRSSDILHEILDFLGFPGAPTLGTLHANRKAKPDVMLRHALKDGYAFTRVSGKLYTESSIGNRAGNQIQRITRPGARVAGLLPSQHDLSDLADKWLSQGVGLRTSGMEALGQWLSDHWVGLVESCAFGSEFAERAAIIMAVKVRSGGDGYDRAVDMQAFTKRAFMRRLAACGPPEVSADGSRYGNSLVWLQTKSGDNGKASGDLQAMLSVPSLLT